MHMHTHMPLFGLCTVAWHQKGMWLSFNKCQSQVWLTDTYLEIRMWFRCVLKFKLASVIFPVFYHTSGNVWSAKGKWNTERDKPPSCRVWYFSPGHCHCLWEHVNNCVYTWLHGQIAGHQCRVLQNQYPHKYLGQEFQHNFSIINNSKYYHWKFCLAPLAGSKQTCLC